MWLGLGLLVVVLTTTTTARTPVHEIPPSCGPRVLRWTEPNDTATATTRVVTRRSLQSTGEAGYLSTGEPSCPCLKSTDVVPITADDLKDEYKRELAFVDWNTFGIGCSTHDQGTTQTCRDCTSDPQSLLCPHCTRPWCYVDPDECKLLYSQGDVTVDPSKTQYYSYATCRNMDSFTNTVRLASLKGRTFRVGINHHPGGWLGAYHPEGLQYEGPLEQWHGPVVDFVRVATQAGQFNIELTRPPPFLKNRSTIVGPNFFDECIYATSLGFLDFCIGTYAITNQRATVTDFAVLAASNFYLVVKGAQPESLATAFNKNAATVFLPFQRHVWYFVVFFVIPLLGVLFVVHEYGRNGSIYPKEGTILIKKDSDNREGDDTFHAEEIAQRTIPLYRHVVRSLYISFLSVLQQGYDNSVMAPGSYLHLLGFSFFILTFLAVYTANLAAILTEQAIQVDVTSLNDAMRRGYKICAIREVAYIAMQNQGINSNAFIVDPIIGGPGYASPSIDRIARVLDFIDPKKATAEQDLPIEERKYCHVGLAFEQDLQVAQSLRQHCNKTIVGETVGSVSAGFPLFEGVSRELLALFLALKNEQWHIKAIAKNIPTNMCSFRPAIKERAQGESLRIGQLSGIWLVAFGFAQLGLIVSFCTRCAERQKHIHTRSIYRFNQHGERINRMERGDSWIRGRNMTFSLDNRGNFISTARRQETTKQTTTTTTTRTIRRNKVTKFDLDYEIPERAFSPSWEDGGQRQEEKEEEDPTVGSHEDETTPLTVTLSPRIKKKTKKQKTKHAKSKQIKIRTQGVTNS